MQGEPPVFREHPEWQGNFLLGNIVFTGENTTGNIGVLLLVKCFIKAIGLLQDSMVMLHQSIYSGMRTP
ncbi:MAG: hypothetical protein V2I36_18255 [Desulfopila sp.]|nr:hypothetical protein [Desulfopila sp.]